MPALREQDFDKLATEVVDAYFAKRSKLADAAAQVAMQNGLNPDQIERLTQSANTMAFLRMMEDTKAQGGQDLTQEFDPIDSRQVIRIVIDNTGVHVEADPSVNVQQGSSPDMGGAMGGGMEHELPDEMSALRDPSGEGEALEASGAPPAKEPKAPPFGKKDKTKTKDDEGNEDAAEDKPKKDKKPETPKEAGFRIMRMRKLAGILEDQLLQAGLYFEETSEKLATRFKKLYSGASFDAFEKDALAEYGDEYGISILNAMRESRNLPALEMNDAHSKVASLADRHITEDTVELRLFGELVKTAQEAKRLEKGIAALRSQCA